MNKKRFILQVISICIVISIYFIKPPTNYILIILLLQGLACIYYGLHLINRGQAEGYGNTFISNIFAQNDEASKKIKSYKVRYANNIRWLCTNTCLLFG